MGLGTGSTAGLTSGKMMGHFGLRSRGTDFSYHKLKQTKAVFAPGDKMT
jgi:hypothetical protein